MLSIEYRKKQRLFLGKQEDPWTLIGKPGLSGRFDFTPLKSENALVTPLSKQLSGLERTAGHKGQRYRRGAFLSLCDPGRSLQLSGGSLWRAEGCRSLPPELAYQELHKIIG